MNRPMEWPEPPTETNKVDQSELIRRWAAHVDVCDTCGGDGWIRANKYEGGKYIFGKETCYACNGEGKTEYVTCPHCRAVVPAKYAAEHECGD